MPAPSLEQTYLAYRPELERFLRARCGDADSTQNLMQDLWLKLSRADEAKIIDPLPYLYRMVNNLVLDRHRSAQHRGQREDAWRGLEVSPCGFLQDQLVERQVRHRSAQPGILFLQLFHPSGKVHLQAAVFFTPAIITLFGNTDPSAGISIRSALCFLAIPFLLRGHSQNRNWAT